MTDAVFDLDAWQAYAETPWARIRYAVVRETLSRWTGATPMKVLDVGGGDGRDVIPLAAAGHHVTLLDPDETLLAAASAAASAHDVPLRTVPGGLEDLGHHTGYDLVLCHFVLPYRPADAADLDILVDAVAPGGRLSLIGHNPVGRTLFTLVREGPAAAYDELDRTSRRSEGFGHDMRVVDPDETAGRLADAGMELVGRYGGRIANDLLTDNDAKLDPAYYADLERLELALCDREPFCRIGAFWQLVARKPG